MATEASLMEQYYPVLIMAGLALGFVITTMVVSHLIGPKRNSAIKDSSFECGLESQGNARTPFSIKYFLVAILFVLFDVEVIFMYPWAVNFRELGLFGLVEMFTFMGMMIVGLIYVVKRGALKWDIE
jgi:NADH-quinone oxidoreductase subunit A